MSTFSFFPTKWDSYDNVVRIYGLIKNNQRPTCLVIKNFASRFLLEFTDKTISSCDFFCFFEKLMKKNHCIIVSKKIVYMKKIIGAHVNSDGSQKEFEFWEVYISRNFVAKVLKKLIRESEYSDQVEIHEEWIDLWYQLALFRKISICNWLQISDAFPSSAKHSICDEEFVVQINNIIDDPQLSPPPPIPILAYDIEVYTHFEERYENRFPNAKEPNDCIFMISMVFQHMGRDDELGDDFVLLLTTCNIDVNLIQPKFPNFVVKIIKLKSEISLLEKFNECLKEFQPLLIFGYNNLSFDHAYMITRAEENQCWSSFQKASMCNFVLAQKKDISWSSSARPDEKFVFVQGEGFTYGDVLTLIKKDHKLTSYSLSNVSSHFLTNENKHDITPQGMTLAYKLSLTKPDDPAVVARLSEIAAYCIQDSMLVLKLIDQLKYVNSLIALSNLTNCKIEDLMIRGTLQKVLFLIIRFAKPLNIVVQKIDKTKETNTETFRGATVFTPIYGVHHNLISLDFASLYPSLIEAYNLCASTLVKPGDLSIPLDKCKVYEWEDHVGCEHDLNYNVPKIKNLEQCLSKLKPEIYTNDYKFEEFLKLKKEMLYLKDQKPNKIYCEKRKYIFYEGYPGIYPRIVKMLKEARSEIKIKMGFKKKQLEKLKEQNNDSDLILLLTNEVIALNAEQLAVKVIANSLYGFTGAPVSPIPSIPIAACVTFLGRTNIEKASQIIRKDFGGIRVYGDTDSNYIKLAEGLTYHELDSLGKEISNDVSNKFPSCLRIEYEGEIYARYLIINKKQYCYLVMKEDGTIKEKMGAKGLLLVKRDNCAWVRSCYEKVIRQILLENPTYQQIEDKVLQECFNLIYGNVSLNQLTISKQVGDWGNKKTNVVDQKTKMGKYTIRQPNAEKLAKFSNNIEEYNISALPAHVQLAIRMTELGMRVNPGERIEYVVTGLPKKKDVGMGDKIQTVNLFQNNKFLRIDFYYYIKLLIVNLDTILDIVRSRVFIPKHSSYDFSASSKGILKHKFKLMSIYKDNFLKGRLFQFLDQIKKKIELNNEFVTLFKPKMIIYDENEPICKN